MTDLNLVLTNVLATITLIWTAIQEIRHKYQVEANLKYLNGGMGNGNAKK